LAIGLASGVLSGKRTNITLYCTPFFPGCKEKFYKFPTFFEKFLKGKEKCGNYPADSPVQPDENRLQQSAQGGLLHYDAQKQTGGVAKTQIPTA